MSCDYLDYGQAKRAGPTLPGEQFVGRATALSRIRKPSFKINALGSDEICGCKTEHTSHLSIIRVASQQCFVLQAFTTHVATRSSTTTLNHRLRHRNTIARTTSNWNHFLHSSPISNVDLLVFFAGFFCHADFDNTLAGHRKPTRRLRGHMYGGGKDTNAAKTIQRRQGRRWQSGSKHACIQLLVKYTDSFLIRLRHHESMSEYLQGFGGINKGSTSNIYHKAGGRDLFGTSKGSSIVMLQLCTFTSLDSLWPCLI
jgi:hypothetical protein